LIIVRLAILSLQHLLNQAVPELIAIGERQLLPLRGTDAYDVHRKILRRIEHEVCLDIGKLCSLFDHISGATAKIVLRAALDIAFKPSGPQFPIQLASTISNYTADGHDGMVYILKMRQMEECMTPTDDDIDVMILARNRFTCHIEDALDRHNLQHLFFSTVEDTQLFIPAVMFKIPAVVKAVQKDGRPDFLYRPVGYMLHDNGVAEKFRFPATGRSDGDLLGRTSLHIVCAMAEHEHDFIDTAEGYLDGMSELMNNSKLGLSSLHVAAIHGNRYIFENASASNYLTIGDLASLSSGIVRTCLHWAACFGHTELVDCILT
jgi:hypothetical protein